MQKKKKLKRLQHTLMIAFLMLSITPLTLLAVFFLESHTSDLKTQSTNHLAFLRDTKKDNLINYFNDRHLEVKSFANSELATSSGGRFYGLIAAFQQLGKTTEKARQQLRANYAGSEPPQSPVKTHSHFLGSERYRLLHKRYDISFREHIKRSDFVDILLVDITGNVVYSVEKDTLLGANLLNDRWKNTPVGRTFADIKSKTAQPQEENTEFPVSFSDFKQDAKGEMTSWFAAPIQRQGYLHSYVMFRLPNFPIVSELNKNIGFNEMVTTYLFGQDQLARNQNDTEQGSKTALKALQGNEGVGSFLNSNNVPVIGAYTPLTILGYDWALSLETPEDHAFAQIRQLETFFIIVMLTAIILVFIASHWLSNFITAPLLKLTWIAEQVAAGDLEQPLSSTDREDEVGRLAQSFAMMQASIRDKLALISQQNKELEQNIQLIKIKNKELQQADRMKDDFLATTSHELRTPLHGMIGIAESLLAGADGMTVEQQKQQLPLLINSGQRLSALVDDLLDYHKMRYGSLDIKTKAIDSASAVRLVIELASHLIGAKPIRIINQMPIDLPLIRADEQRLEQVLYNLIGNAIKYTDEGKIIISATKLDRDLRIQVVDTGQGIPAEQLTYIFEPLTQARENHYTPHQGAGLGLSISRQLIEIMGGQLYVSSQPMVGTTFSFTLPFATEEDKANTQLARQLHFNARQLQPESIEIKEIITDPNAPLVLVVDDEPVNLQVLNNFLQLEGYRVKTVENGRQAIEFITIEKPDLLLLDVMMPELSGYEVCEHLRERYSRSDLPIILLSALSQVQDKVKGFDAGANDFLTKPFNKDELSARIGAYISASVTEQWELKNQKLEKVIMQKNRIESALREVQKRLFSILHSASESILCTDKHGQIVYANENCATLFQLTSEQMTRHQLNDFLAQPLPQLPFNDSHFSGTVEFVINEKEWSLNVDVIHLPEQSDLSHLIILNNGTKSSTQRVRLLEHAIDSLSEFALNGDADKLQQLRELGGEFTRLADKFKSNRENKQHIVRETLVKVMTLTLTYWHDVTGKSKFDLAEESGLWRVYLDRSTLQTRTLDKYLHVETVPKSPRWRTVLSTIDFVLERCTQEGADRKELLHLKDRLQLLMASK